MNFQVQNQQNLSSHAEKLLSAHKEIAMDSYRAFEKELLKSLSSDLSSIETELNKQLDRVSRKLRQKIKDGYDSSLKSQINKFFLEPYVKEQYDNITDSVKKLRLKIFEYINEFCEQVLARNIKNNNQVSLFYYQNRIKHVFSDWYSVTSRSDLKRAEVIVKGLSRPTTSWIALGVSRQKKEYGPVKNSMKHENFVGNIYLNGSEQFTGGDYKTKKDLQNDDVFVIENQNKMIYVYRKTHRKNPNQVFISEDNTPYYIYIAMKGPITITFIGQSQ